MVQPGSRPGAVGSAFEAGATLGRWGAGLWREEGADEGVGDPFTVSLRCPSALDHEELEELGRGTCPEDVSRLFEGDAVSEVPFVGELPSVALHAAEPLVVDVLPEGRCFGIGVGGGADQETAWAAPPGEYPTG